MKTSRLLNIVIFIDSKSEGFIKVRSLYFSRDYLAFHMIFFWLWKDIILVLVGIVTHHQNVCLILLHLWIGNRAKTIPYTLNKKFKEAWARFELKKIHFLCRHGFVNVILIIKQNLSVSRRVE